MKNVRRMEFVFFKFAGSALCLLTLLCLAHSASAQPKSELDALQRAGRAQNPSDVSFTVSVANEQKQFRQGEVIRLELRFASSSPQSYRLDAATYDRSGRLELDKFHLEPETGVSDPMRDHLGIWGGGLRGIPDLEEKPYLIVCDLNEWFRFDQPGSYRLYLSSPRVSRKGQRAEAAAITLTSNFVEFEIVRAEADWTAQELQRILKRLDAKDGANDRRTACRALRFLGAKAAVPELVRRYDEADSECAFEFYAGLLSAPQREFVIERMEAQLVAPTQAVASGWLGLLIQLTIPPWRMTGAYDEQQAQAYGQRHRELYAQAQTKYGGRLAQAIALKTARAKAVSLKTLLDLHWDKTNLPDVATFFHDLLRQDQTRLLEYGWKKIGSAALLPTLRQLYQQRMKGKPEESYERKDLSTLALRRIYELAPEEGRRLILAAMKQPNPRVGLSALTQLPDETLPELDQVFMDNFERGEQGDLHSALIERYASPNLYARVSALLTEKVGELACYEQAHLLAYCLRAEPVGGIALIRRALNAREHTHCYPEVLTGVAALHSSLELEKLALEFLNDADLEVVTGAIKLLGQSGSTEAEAPLWQKFEQWHQVWSGRASVLEVETWDNEPVRLQRGLEQALRTALAQAPAWLTGPQQLARLNQLCVTKQEREQVSHWQDEWGKEIPLRFAPAEQEWGRAEAAHYELNSLDALKQKLAQFPQGTTFRWQPYNEGQGEEAKAELFRAIQTFLAERGMRLVR